MPENYIQQGVHQASVARDMVGNDWSDTWKNYAVQYALAQQEFEHNRQMWDLMNEYNSPASQMQRFQEAGLNPNLIYSQGTPGNASSQVNFKRPSAEISPQKDTAARISMANEVIGMVSNLAGNLTNLIDQGLNVQLKRNQLVQSDFETALLRHQYPYFDSKTGGIVSAFHNGELPLTLNPLSPNFDANSFLFFSKHGQLPQFWNNYLSGVSTRQLNEYKAEYQKYYIENILPLFEKFQQGKVGLQDIELGLKSYNKQAVDMLPPEIRGILEPLIHYLSPFLNLLFK